jgi:hypothetical protein
MRLFLKISILTLVFQFVLGSSKFYKQEQKKKENTTDMENRLRKFCSIVENYDVERCITLRFKDIEILESQRIAEVNQYCQKNPYTIKCMDKFKILSAFFRCVFYILNKIFTVLSFTLLLIPFLFLFVSLSFAMKHT